MLKVVALSVVVGLAAGQHLVVGNDGRPLIENLRDLLDVRRADYDIVDQNGTNETMAPTLALEDDPEVVPDANDTFAPTPAFVAPTTATLAPTAVVVANETTAPSASPNETAMPTAAPSSLIVNLTEAPTATPTATPTLVLNATTEAPTTLNATTASPTFVLLNMTTEAPTMLNVTAPTGPSSMPTPVPTINATAAPTVGFLSDGCVCAPLDARSEGEYACYFMDDNFGRVLAEAESLNPSGTSFELADDLTTESDSPYYVATASFGLPTDGPLKFSILLDFTGTFKIDLFAAFTISEKLNTCWIKVQGAQIYAYYSETQTRNESIAYPDGVGLEPVIDDGSSDGWLRVFTPPGRTGFNWKTQTDKGSAADILFDVDEPGEVVILISARSEGFAIDKILTYPLDVSQGRLGQMKSHLRPETPCVGSPTFSPAPTPAPTYFPTLQPTAPSYAPTVTPSPSTQPVAEPTETPVAEPTETPVAEPTETPVAEPTETPVAEPTEAPVGELTEAPVAEPTETPVAEPTEAPVAEPTMEPVPEPTPEADQPQGDCVCDTDVEDRDTGEFVCSWVSDSWGRVIVEIESVDNSKAEGFEFTSDNSFDGYTGTGYYLYTGPDYFNEPGNDELSVPFELEEAGEYRIEMRSAITIGDETTEHNDLWMKMEGAQIYGYSPANDERGESYVYPADVGLEPVAQGATSDGWMKVYRAAEGTDWDWSTFTSDHDGHEVRFDADSPGTYELLISSRSNGHAVDKVMAWPITIPSNQRSRARNNLVPETYCT